MKKWIGFFMILSGIAMISMWAFFLITGKVPELQTTPFAIGTHIMAEIASGFMMFIEGVGLFQERPYAERTALYAFGMFMYSVIQAPGYFWEQGDYIFSAMFGVFLAFGLISVRHLLQTH